MLRGELIRAGENDSRRLMVMLHGLGDSLAGWRWLPEALGLRWLNVLLVNAPDEYLGGYSWFDLNDIVPGVRRSRRLLFELLDDLQTQNFPTEQTTLGGFSQGCVMALEAALRYPRRFAGVVGISGWVCEAETAVRELSPVARQQRVLMTHGTDDPLVPIHQVRPQIPLLRAAGLRVAWREFPKAHTIHGEDEIAIIREFLAAGYGGNAEG